MSYRISVNAAEDIEQIWLYTVDNWSVEQADRYVNLIFDEMEYLADNPVAGKDLTHIRKDYRSSKVKSHLIFYRLVEKNDIEIIRVLHQRMDIVNQLEEME